MATITLRSVKGSPLTNTEVDDNFNNINTELGTKLPTSSYTAADVLAKLLTVDGVSSGIEATTAYNLGGVSANGLLVRTAANTHVPRTITGTTNEIDVTNGDGVSGNPTLAIGSNIPKKNAANTWSNTNTFTVFSANGVENDLNSNLFLGLNSLTTTSINGFPYIPVIAGQPTSTPTSNTGRSPIVWDSTNAKLWIYSGGAWNGAGGSVTAGDTAPTPDTIAQRDGNGDLYAVNFVSSSDATLKENIRPITNALNTVGMLNGVWFDWKHTGQTQMGFIAQEVEKVLPSLVSESMSILDAQSHKVLNYPVITSLLVEAIKELQARIEALEGK